MSLNKAPKNNVFYRNQNWHYPKIEKGEGIYLFDDKGNKYIDACSGSAVANIGHGNKEVAEYAKEQIEKIAFTHLSRWTVDTIEECAKKVSKLAGGDLNHVYFVSGGSESTETAIKMARQYFVERDGQNTKKRKVISKWNSFHGNTMGSLSMTGIPSRRKIYEPILIDFPKITQFYHYRNPWNTQTLYDTSVKAAQELQKCIDKEGAENISAFITEGVVGSAVPGLHPDKIYFEMVREICDNNDILFIVDEVMSGFGRTGIEFSYKHYGVTPDIVTCAKGMSSGYSPLGACICNDKIFDTIMVKGSGHFVHGHTYASNPLSCGIGVKVLEIIERENYIENARKMGDIFNEKLKNLLDLPYVGDVRGKGLLSGIEFVENKVTKMPLETSKNYKGLITNVCLENKIVVYPGSGTYDGVRGDHILLAPPINITEEQINDLYSKLEKSIIEASKKI